ncbi:MAG: hypothetical protein EAZ57_11035 [Cytophagales bacterium]|nr:MAG: hypothetical protein EAZ67_11520 [Cytophagales bacterium]TAF59504.1 MAG: hypothetical protein EAZ57_11035 [Cytophagales bacterium]
MDNTLIKYFGVRHHGPGSARYLLEALQQFEPDVILCEGPDAASELISWCKSNEETEQLKSLVPPVAVLVYATEKPHLANFYPFAEFSPEWQAIQYALKANVLFKFMDLPQQNMLALQEQPLEQGAQNSDELGLDWYAEQFGYSDTEHWWDFWIESRPEQSDVFEAVSQLMHIIREGKVQESTLTLLRESAMRLAIQDCLKTQKPKKLAVICGAYHLPALEGQKASKSDKEALKSLPKIKVNATWIPWTYERLAIRSGYGAGIHSPRWYEFIWQHQKEAILVWTAAAAGLMRQKDLPASSAHVQEAVRLAYALASMREKAMPGLDELKSAALAVLCEGQETVFNFIEKELLIGQKIGYVPAEMPSLPIQKDFYALIKKYRLKLLPGKELLELDLRQALHLQKSAFLNRLLILDIPFGYNRQTYNKKGTFHDHWELRWRPEYEIGLVEANRWGSTIENAALAKVLDVANEADSSKQISTLLTQLLLADLPSAVPYLLEALRNKTAQSIDLTALIDTAKPLAAILRYGNVRLTDQEAVASILADLCTKICIGIPGIVKNTDEDFAAKISSRLEDLQQIVRKLENQNVDRLFEEMLLHLALSPLTHGLISGKANRICYDASLTSPESLQEQMSLALNTRLDALHAANWLDGFLDGSVHLLIYQDKLFEILDTWLMNLSESQFIEALAILRRTFARYSHAERDKIKQKTFSKKHTTATSSMELEPMQIAALEPLLRKLGYVQS